MIEHLVWWISPEEVWAIRSEKLDKRGWPPWLATVFVSIAGRKGHGRVSVAGHLGQVGIPPAHPAWQSPLGKVCANRSGIVLTAAELPLLFDLPGLVTDLGLRRLPAALAALANIGTPAYVAPEQVTETPDAVTFALTFERAKLLAAVMRARHPWLTALVELSAVHEPASGDVVALEVMVDGETQRYNLNEDTTLGDLDDWASLLWRQWIALRPVRAAVPAARLPEALDEDGNEGATQ